MRIIAGRYRGAALSAPKDARIRPTSDRVREAIFNILVHGGFAPPLEGARVLDLFAGTGALGLEALSRGAGFVTFVDDHPQSRALIRRNIEALHAGGRTKVWQRDATALGPLPRGEPFDLVFLDPPYGRALVEPSIRGVIEGGWVKSRAAIIAEFESTTPPIEIDAFDLAADRIYGDTRVAFWASAGSLASIASA